MPDVTNFDFMVQSLTDDDSDFYDFCFSCVFMIFVFIYCFILNILL